MTDFFLVFGTILGIAIGFYFGLRINVEEIRKDKKHIADIITNALDQVDSDLQVGVLRRPSAHEVFLRNEDDKKKASKKAMKETLDTIPELKKAREAAAKQK
ncbi:MAG: hypothetical protein KGJ89_05320 [Patescibacteria group bacterium]|nr:hypothetical protein [Patescibacteria group bacterium]MDE2015854.1 hypothetical protein [Patescibacteria group bacterium]MDE2227343.1 hypothetical protein [Patescibacteria group bacterium]